MIKISTEGYLDYDSIIAASQKVRDTWVSDQIVCRIYNRLGIKVCPDPRFPEKEEQLQAQYNVGEYTRSDMCVARSDLPSLNRKDKQ